MKAQARPTSGRFWLAGRFRTIGFTDFRIPDFPLVPQWVIPAATRSPSGPGPRARSWSRRSPSAFVGAPSTGLDIEAVYVGPGAEADCLGRDMRGKAVFVYSMLGAPELGALDDG